MRLSRSLLVWSLCLVWSGLVFSAEPPVDYEQSVAPLLRKYCAGCHNDKDLEGDFSLESFAALQKGIKDKPAVLPGDSAGSRLWRVVSGQADPKMPPEKEPAPAAADLQLLKLWIDQGAKGPAGAEPDRMTLHVPKIESRTKLSPVTALDYSPRGDLLAVARYESVEIYPASAEGGSSKDAPPATPLRRLTGFPGKVEAVHFCLGGDRIITASGVGGAGGVATLWDAATGEKIRDFKGHRDILFDAEVSPDGKLLATCSYDRDIILWNLETGAPVRTLAGHNGAVYDVAFHPTGMMLGSASADDTCKLWRVRDGERLDTLPQPLKEVYSIEFTPDGKFVAAAGADNRIRVWKLLSLDKPIINPLVQSRFAHEAPITRIGFTKDGGRLVSLAEDRTLKAWATKDYAELKLWKDQPEVSVALAIAPQGDRFTVGRLNGTWQTFPLPPIPAPTKPGPAQEVAAEAETQATMPAQAVAEKEPNNLPNQAQAISLPARISGVIDGKAGTPADLDCFKFTAKAGQEWVIDVDAALSKSALDSFIEVLTPEGDSIERVMLQAVRDSYFTFRGKNGTQADDFRIFNWEEMEVNQFLYANGEVVKLWQMPRGPDSGFLVFPGSGERWGYFDTTSLSHALGEPCYVVEPHAPGTELIPNGLPQFHIYYENDDSARRESGKDSKLFFTAPEDGEYVLRVRDIRGEQGPGYTYAVSLRASQPDFSVSLAKRKLKVDRGSAAELKFVAKRMDQFDGPITIEATGLPPGIALSLPLLIEDEQIDALASLMAAADAAMPTPEQLKNLKLTASAMIRGRKVTHDIAGIEELKINEKTPLLIAIVPAPEGAKPLASSVPGGPLEFEIAPGQTIMLKVIVQRNDFKDVIGFGTADSGRNLPFGVYVDNIGLNGLLMLADQSEREFFITASEWTPEQTRMFHLQTEAAGGQSSPPVMLHVRKPPAPAVAQP